MNNGTLNDVVHKLYQGVLYFQKILRCHSARMNVVLFTAMGKYALPWDHFLETHRPDNQRVIEVRNPFTSVRAVWLSLGQTARSCRNRAHKKPANGTNSEQNKLVARLNILL
jgi:hypothetical protein